MKPRNKEKGVVLVTVFWVLFFLSVAALTLSVNSRLNTRIRGLRNEEIRMYYLAWSGINAALAKLADDGPGTFDSLLDDWTREITFSGETGDVSCVITDEDRFLNINLAPAEILENLGRIFARADPELIKRILKLRPFNVTRELLGVEGFDPEMFYADNIEGGRGMERMFSVFSPDRFNINTVEPDVLRLIPALNQSSIEAILDKRNYAPFAESARLSEELSLLGLTPAEVSALIKVARVNSEVFRISARAVSRQKHVSREIQIVGRRDKGRFKILLFKEN